MQRGVCRRAVLRTSEEQATEIHFRMHWWVIVCRRGWEGGEVWLYPLRLLNHVPGSFGLWKMLYTSWPYWTHECFIVEIIEIYCKIQNRLIFIMRMKTFFLHLEKKKEMLELKLPQHWRSIKNDTPEGIRAMMETMVTWIHLRNLLETSRSTYPGERRGSLCWCEVAQSIISCALVCIYAVHEDRPSTCVWVRVQGRWMELQHSQPEWMDEKYFVQNVKYPEDLGSIHQRRREC